MRTQTIVACLLAVGVTSAFAEGRAYSWKTETVAEETVDFWPSQPSGEGITYSDSPFTLSYNTQNGHFINLAVSPTFQEKRENSSIA